MTVRRSLRDYADGALNRLNDELGRAKDELGLRREAPGSSRMEQDPRTEGAPEERPSESQYVPEQQEDASTQTVLQGLRGRGVTPQHTAPRENAVSPREFAEHLGDPVDTEQAERSRARAQHSVFSRGVQSGLHQLKAGVEGLGALGAGIVGAEDTATNLAERAGESLEEASEIGPRSSFRGVMEGEDGLNEYLAGVAGAQLPILATFVGSGGAGGILARTGTTMGRRQAVRAAQQASRQGIRRADDAAVRSLAPNTTGRTAREASDNIASAATARERRRAALDIARRTKRSGPFREQLGAGAATGATGTSLHSADTSQFLIDPEAAGDVQHRAMIGLGTAATAALAEIVPTVAVLRNVGLGRTAAHLRPDVLQRTGAVRRIGVGGGKQSALEGTAEVMSEVTKTYGHSILNDNIELFDEDSMWQYLEGLVAGAIIGGASGSATSVRGQDFASAGNMISNAASSLGNRVMQVREPGPTESVFNERAKQREQAKVQRKFESLDPEQQQERMSPDYYNRVFNAGQTRFVGENALRFVNEDGGTPEQARDAGLALRVLIDPEMQADASTPDNVFTESRTYLESVFGDQTQNVIDAAVLDLHASEQNMLQAAEQQRELELHTPRQTKEETQSLQQAMQELNNRIEGHRRKLALIEEEHSELLTGEQVETADAMVDQTDTFEERGTTEDEATLEAGGIQEGVGEQRAEFGETQEVESDPIRFPFAGQGSEAAAIPTQGVQGVRQIRSNGRLGAIFPAGLNEGELSAGIIQNLSRDRIDQARREIEQQGERGGDQLARFDEQVERAIQLDEEIARTRSEQQQARRQGLTDAEQEAGSLIARLQDERNQLDAVPSSAARTMPAGDALQRSLEAEMPRAEAQQQMLAEAQRTYENLLDDAQTEGAVTKANATRPETVDQAMEFMNRFETVVEDAPPAAMTGRDEATLTDYDLQPQPRNVDQARESGRRFIVERPRGNSPVQLEVQDADGNDVAVNLNTLTQTMLSRVDRSGRGGGQEAAERAGQRAQEEGTATGDVTPENVNRALQSGLAALRERGYNVPDVPADAVVFRRANGREMTAGEVQGTGSARTAAAVDAAVGRTPAQPQSQLQEVNQDLQEARSWAQGRPGRARRIQSLERRQRQLRRQMERSEAGREALAEVGEVPRVQDTRARKGESQEAADKRAEQQRKERNEKAKKRRQKKERLNKKLEALQRTARKVKVAVQSGRKGRREAIQREIRRLQGATDPAQVARRQELRFYLGAMDAVRSGEAENETQALENKIEDTQLQLRVVHLLEELNTQRQNTERDLAEGVEGQYKRALEQFIRDEQRGVNEMGGYIEYGEATSPEFGAYGEVVTNESIDTALRETEPEQVLSMMIRRLSNRDLSNASQTMKDRNKAQLDHLRQQRDHIRKARKEAEEAGVEFDPHDYDVRMPTGISKPDLRKLRKDTILQALNDGNLVEVIQQSLFPQLAIKDGFFAELQQTLREAADNKSLTQTQRQQAQEQLEGVNTARDELQRTMRLNHIPNYQLRQAIRAAQVAKSRGKSTAEIRNAITNIQEVIREVAADPAAQEQRSRTNAERRRERLLGIRGTVTQAQRDGEATMMNELAKNLGLDVEFESITWQEAQELSPNRNLAEHDGLAFSTIDENTGRITTKVWVNEDIGTGAARQGALLHEFGHGITDSLANRLTDEEAARVWEAYEQWAVENGKPTASIKDIQKSKRSLLNMLNYREGADHKLGNLTKAEQANVLAFHEWMADQVSRWATTSSEPRGVVEKFFKRIADFMRQLAQRFNTRGEPDTTVAQIMDNLWAAKQPRRAVRHFHIWNHLANQSENRVLNGEFTQDLTEAIQEVKAQVGDNSVFNEGDGPGRVIHSSVVSNQSAFDVEGMIGVRQVIIAKLTSRERQVLAQALNKPAVRRQMVEQLRNMGRDADGIMDDVFSTMAIGYQLWEAGKLNLNPPGSQIFEAVKRMIRRIMGRVSTAKKAHTILDAIAEDRVALRRSGLAEAAAEGSYLRDGAYTLSTSELVRVRELLDSANRDTFNKQQVLEILKADRLMGRLPDPMQRRIAEDAANEVFTDELVDQFKDASDYIMDPENSFALTEQVAQTEIQRWANDYYDHFLGLQGTMRHWMASKFFIGEAMRARWAQNDAITQFSNDLYADVMSEGRGTSYLAEKERNRGRFSNIYLNATDGLTEAQATELVDAYYKRSEATDPAVKKALATIRRLNRQMRNYAKENGLDIGDRGDDYAPWVFDPSTLEQESGRLREVWSQNKFREDWFRLYRKNNPDRVDPGQTDFASDTQYQDYVKHYINGIISQTNGLADVEMPSQSTLDPTPHVGAMNTRDLAFLEKKGTAEENQILRGLFSDDINAIQAVYIDQMVKRVEYARKFGKDGEKFDQRVRDARALGATNEDIKLMQNMLHSAMGTQGLEVAPFWKTVMKPVSHILGRDVTEDPKSFRHLQGAMVTYQNIRLLAFAALTNVADVAGIAVRTGDLSMAWNAYKQGFAEVKQAIQDRNLSPAEKRARRSSLERLAEEMGVVVHSNVSDVLGQFYGGNMMSSKARKWNDAFFRYNGMEFLTRTTRMMALAAGREFMTFHARQAANGNRESAELIMELGIDPRDISVANGELDLLGSDRIAELLEGTSVDNASTARDRAVSEHQFDKMQEGEAKEEQAVFREIARDDRVKQALYRMVDESTLRPAATQRPTWMNDPNWMLFSHLKGFMYTYHERPTRRAYSRAIQGAYTPAIALSLYVGVMMSADLLREFLQHGPEGDPMKANWGFGDRLLDGVHRAGVLGIGTIPQDMLKTREMGGSVLAQQAGPAVSQIAQWQNALFDSGRLDVAAKRALPASQLIDVNQHWGLNLTSPGSAVHEEQKELSWDGPPVLPGGQ